MLNCKKRKEMENEILTFSPADNELLLSEMEMMEVYGGTGDEGGTNTNCGNAKCKCTEIKVCQNKFWFFCGGSNSGGSGNGSGSGSGSGSGNGSGSGSGKGN